MAEKQYQLSVKNVDVTLEEGHFFKVLPFVIKIENVSYDVVFEKGLNHAVVYSVKKENKTLFQLYHPDYIPDVTIHELNQIYNNDDVETLFYALFYLGISSDKSYREYLFSDQSLVKDFEVFQLQFI